MRGKIKRNKRSLTLKLHRSVDILTRVAAPVGAVRCSPRGTAAKLGRKKVVVGFSLETDGLKAEAVKKLRRKQLDLVVANLYAKKHNPFGDRKASVLLVYPSGRVAWIKNQTKKVIARTIVSQTESIWQDKIRDASLTGIDPSRVCR